MAAEAAAVRRIVHAALDDLAAGQPALGIALSGGGDSTALMHLAQGWGRVRLYAATVDHRLRPESAAEAAQAGLAARALGIPHETLLWSGDKGGNLMAAAREARLRLLSDWARRQGLTAVLLGHTLDDQAETLLMRLARGAGVDGLAGMAPAREAHGIRWLRPMLAVSRADLRAWLGGQGIGWVDDPSNLNPDYERVRIRQALAALDLPLPQLAQTAANLAMAREALQDCAAHAATGGSSRAGALALPLAAFRAAAPEIRRRLLVAGLRLVNGAAYAPRRAPVLHLLDALGQDGRLTLDGVILEARGAWLRLIREPAAALRSPPLRAGGAVWDRRWQVTGLAPGLEVRALGHAPLPALNWRESGLSRDEAAASPGIWDGGRLLCAPLLQPGPVGVTALRGWDEFRALIYSH